MSRSLDLEFTRNALEQPGYNGPRYAKKDGARELARMNPREAFNANGLQKTLAALGEDREVHRLALGFFLEVERSLREATAGSDTGERTVRGVRVTENAYDNVGIGLRSYRFEPLDNTAALVPLNSMTTHVEGPTLGVNFPISVDDPLIHVGFTPGPWATEMVTGVGKHGLPAAVTKGGIHLTTEEAEHITLPNEAERDAGAHRLHRVSPQSQIWLVTRLLDDAQIARFTIKRHPGLDKPQPVQSYWCEYRNTAHAERSMRDTSKK